MVITFKAIPSQYSVSLTATEGNHSIDCTFTNEFNIAQAIKCTIRNFYKYVAEKEIAKQIGGF
jgi:hypothetical protein